MADKRNQSPHYIPELDPENKRFPGADSGMLIYGILTLLPFSTLGVYFGFKSNNTYLLVLGLFSLVVTLASIIITMTAKLNKADIPKNRAVQSPHYIPELDPENKKHSSAMVEQAFLWIEYLGYAAFFVSLVIAIAAWAVGWQTVLIGASVVGSVIGGGLVFSRTA